MRTRDSRKLQEQELNRLRARIAELESQLRRVSGAGRQHERAAAAAGFPEAGRSGSELRDQSPDRFRKALSIETVGVLFFRLDGHMTDANDAFERMSGYSREELRSMEHWEVLTAREFMGVAMRSAENLATAGKTPPYEKQMIRKDGSRWWGLFAPTRLSGAGWNSECMEFIIDITATKQAEEELRIAEARLRTTLESIGDEVWIVDAQGRLVLVNEAMTEHLGVPRDHWPDIHAAVAELEIFYPDGTPRPPEQAVLLRCLRGEALRGELELVRNVRTHELRWREITASPVRDPGGTITGAVGIVRDITERKRMEDALRESEARYRAVFDGAAIGMGRVSFADARWIEVNETFCGMLGYTREELQATPWPEITHPEDIDLDLIPFRRMAAGELDSYTVEKRFIHKLGHTFWARLTLSLVRDAAGQPDYEIAVIEDITSRKQAEEALRESERRLRELADSMPQLVWAADEAGALTYVNRQLAEQIGLPLEQVVGDAWVQVLHPEDRNKALPYWRHCVETGERFQTEYRLRTSSGEYRWFLARGVPIRDEQGRITRWYGTSTDIDDSKRAEERLRQAQKLESVGLLAGGIAHDFNNLLTGILGNASLALDSRLAPDAADRVRQVMSSAERAANLTQQLLAYSGKGQFVVREIDISQAVNEMTDLMQFSIPNSIELSVNVRRRLPTVQMDPGQLQQVLMNLVINAGEAIGEGNPGRIAVATSMTDIEQPFIDAAGGDVAPGRYVCIEVSDTGSGMDEEQKSKIFDPFFTTKFTGRGLGLAAVAGILRTQRGGITVESEPGRGSTFRVYLPVAGAGVQMTEEQPAAGRATVLVVDDELVVRDVVGTALRRQGYRVLTASDGREALSVCDRERGSIDAAVLDVVMPIMGANELMPELKARYPEIRILLTSGYGEDEARRLSVAYPGSAFIQKPYTAQQIADEVERLLE